MDFKWMQIINVLTTLSRRTWLCDSEQGPHLGIGGPVVHNVAPRMQDYNCEAYYNADKGSGGSVVHNGL